MRFWGGNYQTKNFGEILSMGEIVINLTIPCLKLFKIDYLMHRKADICNDRFFKG